MPYGYNPDNENIRNIGQDLGTIVASFIKKHKLKKSRLAMEREQKKKEQDLLSQKAEYLRKQLGPDDTDLYTQLTDAPKTPESFALIEPEVTRRTTERAAKSKADEAMQKEQKKLADEQAKLERKTTILQKQLDMSEMPQEVKSQVSVFLDGTPEGYDAARDMFLKWKPEKADKVGLDEERAALRTEIGNLGDGDLNAGLEVLKTNDKQKYNRAIGLGIKGEKQDDPSEPYLKDLVSDWEKSDERKEGMALTDYGKAWIANRDAILSPEVRAKLKARLFPEEQRGTGLMEGMKQEGFQQAVEASDQQVSPEEEAAIKERLRLIDELTRKAQMELQS